MIFVIIWLFDHFTLKPAPLVKEVWIITFVNHLHAWVTKFKRSFVFQVVGTDIEYGWTQLLFLMKHKTLSKHSRRTTRLFAKRSSNSLLSLKIFCWCFSFVNSRACIWLSRPLMACWCSFCIFSMPFLVSHFTKATALGFLEQTAISIALSRLMNISWEIFVFPRGSVTPTTSISDLGREWCDENSLKLSLIFLMPKYFPESDLLNKDWF